MDDDYQVTRIGPARPPRWGLFSDRPILQWGKRQFQISKHGIVFEITGMPQKPCLGDVLDAMLNPADEVTRNLLEFLEED